MGGTLVTKPEMAEKIGKILLKHGISVTKDEIISAHHRVISRMSFPDRTTRGFYDKFNGLFLKQMGVKIQPEIISDIYKTVTKIPWQAYDDTQVLSNLKQPMGIISNWDDSLIKIIGITLADLKFKPVIGSSHEGVQKPDVAIYLKALSQIKFRPQNVLYLGNSVKLDMEPARSAGMRTILIDREDLYPTYKGIKIKSLDQLPEII